MAIVIRGNCELTIADHLIGEYLKKGYSLIDDKGNVVQQADPQNIGDYQRLVKSLKDEVVKLQIERDEFGRINQELRAKIDALQGDKEATTPTEPSPKARNKS